MKTEWIRTEDRNPPMYQRVLVYGVDHYQSEPDVHEAMLDDDGIFKTKEEYSAAPGTHIELEKVTHWMPLPFPPRV